MDIESDDRHPFEMMGLSSFLFERLPGSFTTERLRELLKAIYRDFSKEFHPDRNPGDEEAQDLFKDVSAAYQQLSTIEDLDAAVAEYLERSGGDVESLLSGRLEKALATVRGEMGELKSSVLEYFEQLAMTAPTNLTIYNATPGRFRVLDANKMIEGSGTRKAERADPASVSLIYCTKPGVISVRSLVEAQETVVQNAYLYGVLDLQEGSTLFEKMKGRAKVASPGSSHKRLGGVGGAANIAFPIGYPIPHDTLLSQSFLGSLKKQQGKVEEDSHLVVMIKQGSGSKTFHLLPPLSSEPTRDNNEDPFYSPIT